MKILFIHHSTGALLLHFGKVRKLLKEKTPEIELWDHSYNLYPNKLLSFILGPIMFRTGLSDDKGRMTGKDFNIVISNNSPKEYAEIFSRSTKDITLNNILSFDVVIFKSCFPTSKIETDKKLSEYMDYYRKIMTSISNYANQFIIFTQPPLRAEMNNIKWAKNARKLSNFIKKEAKHFGNIYVFDFFDFLADKKGQHKDMLKREYCNIVPVDSHPNIKADVEIGKHLVDFIYNSCTIGYGKNH